MARPKKKLVDYFPHDCLHGQTMVILEQRYGNDGYALWFKLLEMLGKTEGHYLDFNKAAPWEFLQSITRLSEETCTDILNLLAKLEAIDPELWKFRVIWSANFTARIADVYRNRRVELPPRPSFYIPEPQEKEVSTPKGTQIEKESKKEKESKYIPPPVPLKKSIKKTKTLLPEDFAISEKVRAWAVEQGFDRLEEHLEAFKRKATMNGYVYLNWDMAFMEAIREDWAKIREKRGRLQNGEPEWMNIPLSNSSPAQ